MTKLNNQLTTIFLLFYVFIFNAILTQSSALTYDKSEILSAELTLADLELADVCDDIANGEKNALFQKVYTDKIVAEQSLGHLLKKQSNSLREFESIITGDLERNWIFLVKPGDGILPKKDWDKLVSYRNRNNEFVSVIKLPCVNDTEGCFFTKEMYETILKTSKDVDILNETWSSWQHAFLQNNEAQSEVTSNFSNVLHLVNKAAQLNEKQTAESYWDLLNDYDSVYYKASEFWEEIKPLYLKIHKFVKTRLFNYYKLEESEEIPVFLLGSNFGKDWSHIADKVLPHPQLHYDLQGVLKYRTLKNVYLLVENLTKTLSLGKMGDRFWSQSTFNMSYCQPHLISFCSEKYTEIHDCNEVTWVNYLNAHEAGFEVAVRNQNYDSLIRNNLRYSPVTEAVISLGSLLAIENLPHSGIVSKAVFNTSEEVKMSKLLLMALRTLPKLPYYLAADKWRLSELAIDGEDENIARNWWNLRKEYQGVKGVTGGEYDFLRDECITSNKPYVSKFLGEVLAFQLMVYYQNRMADPQKDNLAVEIGTDSYFISMIKERPTTDWAYLITENYGVDVSTSALLNYFKPLEEYLEKAPLDQAKIVTTTTPKPTSTTKRVDETPGSKVKARIESQPDVNIAVNDDPKVGENSTEISSVEASKIGKNGAMYAGLGLLVFVCCLLVIVFGYKSYRKSRRRTNNRRFET